MPILHPAEVAADRQMGCNRRRDVQAQRPFWPDMCLGMTHEEIMTSLAAVEIRSYRTCPRYGIRYRPSSGTRQRPKSGILRTREFIMKDSYSFDATEEGLESNYSFMQPHTTVFSSAAV